MDDAGKYRIVAIITASGVIERNDVVGAVFGQTEGLLGEDFELRTLQAAERVGRIDVDVSSEAGVSSGTINITTNLDRAETAVLAAALETIERIGPCRASVEIDRIEDVRGAKRRWIRDRAEELAKTGFEDVGEDGDDLVESVRAAIQPVDIDEFAGYPAGPNIEEQDEIVVVEGRADVTRLLQFGVTNVIGVEGTGIPQQIAALTEDRTVTAFFDGDRGGDLLLLELAQVGNVDFVTFAPPGRSVEDLGRADMLEALAERVPYQPSEEAPPPAPRTPSELREQGLIEQIEDVIESGNGALTVLDAEFDVVATDDGDSVVETLESAVGASVVIVDAPITQRLADIATRSDVDMLIGTTTGDFTKRPRDVHIISADRVLNRPASPEQ